MRLGVAPKPANEAEARLQDIEYLAKVLRIMTAALMKPPESNLKTYCQQQAKCRHHEPGRPVSARRKATALADNGHTGHEWLAVRTQFNSVGVRYFQFQDGLFVVRALAEHEQLLRWTRDRNRRAAH